MKKKILLLFTAIITFGTIQAQNVKKENTSFVYTRKPLKPLNKAIKGYEPKVVFTYEDEVRIKKQAYMDGIMDSLTKYQNALDDYHRSLSNSSSASTLLLTSQPQPPVLGAPAYIQKLYNADEFASSYVTLSGYDRGGTNPVTITALVGGFQNEAPILQSKKTRVKQPDNTYAYELKYYYEIKYRVPISVKLENGGKVIEEKVIDRFNNYSSASTIMFETSDQLQAYWNIYETSFLSELDEKAVRGAMSQLGAELDSDYGFRKVTYHTEIFTVKPKKFDYPEYEEAYVQAIAGFNMIEDPAKRAEGNAKLKKAIEWWEKALKDSEPDNKRARIDGQVTAATHVNIAEAAIFAQDFAKAESHISRAKLMKYNKYEREANSLKVLLDDQKRRFEANKNP